MHAEIGDELPPLRRDDDSVRRRLQAAGSTSLRAIARWLTESGVPAPRGPVWHPRQVARELKALGLR